MSSMVLNGEERQEQEQDEEDADSDNNNEDKDSRQPQQDMGEDASLSSETDESQPGQDELGSHSDSYSDDELNDARSDDEDRATRPTRRKRTRPSSSNNGPTQKKQKRTHHLQQQSSNINSTIKKRRHWPQQTPRHKYRADSGSNHHLPNAQTRLDQSSRFPPAPRAMAQLPSPSPSTSGNIISELTYNRLSGDVQPTLIEITFRPHSPHFCSFTAEIQEGCKGQGVSFSQLTRLFESIGYVGQIVDFTFKSLQSSSFLITGFTQHPSPQPSSSEETVSAAEAGRIHRNMERAQTQDSRAVDAGCLVLRSEPSSSSDDSGLSDSDPDVSSDDDGYSSEAKKQGGSSMRMNIPWDPVEEGRLRAYKKEDKSWDWIFKKFPRRSRAAVRSRWTIVQRKDESDDEDAAT